MSEYNILPQHIHNNTIFNILHHYIRAKIDIYINIHFYLYYTSTHLCKNTTIYILHIKNADTTRPKSLSHPAEIWI